MGHGGVSGTYPDGPRLVGDVGGTSVRLAWSAGPGAPLQHEWRDAWTAVHAREGDLGDEIAAWLATLPAHGLAPPVVAAIGVAAPVSGDHVAFTNRAGHFSRAALADRFGFERLLVLNDYAALAHGLAVLQPGEARAVGPHELSSAPTDAPRALIGPGTGLGVAALVPAHDGAVAVGGEGGHVGLAGSNDLEDAVVARLRARHGRASAERALSGEGLENLDRALAEVEGRVIEPRAAADLTAAAQAGDAVALRVLDLFFAFLGHVAGDLALTLGARGGVCVGGGIVPRLGDAIDRSRFRACFEAKGRHAAWMAAIPTAVLADAAGLALRGAAAALDA